MDELEKQYQAVMRQLAPLEANDPLRKGWVTVARAASDKLNKALKFEIARSPKRPSTNADMPNLVKWFRNLSSTMQPKIIAQWAPIRPHFMQRSRQINLDIRDGDADHIDDNDYFNRLATEAVAEAMTENPDAWVSALVRNWAGVTNENDIYRSKI